MAGDEASSSEADCPPAAPSERLAPARRRPWLGLCCAALLVMVGIAGWVHVENPFDPYRDGTTHAASLVNDDSICPDNWGVTLPGFSWQAKSAIPDDWLPGPVAGRVHILRQRSPVASGGQSPFSAVFEARGVKVELVGGREPAFNDLTCAIR